MSENERLIKAFHNLHKEDAKIFDSLKEHFSTGGTLGSLGADDDKSFRFAQKLIRSELPMYRALRSILPPGAISAKRYQQFVRNSLSVLPTESVSSIRRDWTDQAAKSFFATRNNIDPLEYLSGPKDNWVGYDPNNGPLAQRFRELEAVDAQIDYERKLEAEELHRRRMSDKSFEFEMLDKDEQFIQGAMRDKGWSRDQAEQVYFKNLTENTKWLRLIGKSNPKIAKNIIPIAKAVGKASGLPIIGAFARNPAIGAITALIGGGLSAGSYSLGRSGTLAKWMNARAVTGDIGPGTFHGLAATGMSYEQMLQSLFKYSVKSSESRFGGGFDKYAELAKYGVDVSGLFNPYLTAEERRAEEYRVVSSANQADRAAIMAALGMSPEEFRSEKLRHTPRSKWSFSDLQLDIYKSSTKRMKENYPRIDFFIPNKLYELYSFLAANKEFEDRKFLGDNAVDSRREIYNLHRWDEIRETAEIDDRYRAGMYDNSVTNNDTSRSVSLQVNVASPQITTTGDPVDFAKGISIIGSRVLSEYQSIIENTDTKRTK